jgi:hypothetical protein
MMADFGRGFFSSFECEIEGWLNDRPGYRQSWFQALLVSFSRSRVPTPV